MYELMVESSFAAAHQLRQYKGSCENLHGHNWKVQLVVSTRQLNHLGLGIDFKLLKKTLNIYLDQLDHTNLNQLPAFIQENPSSENIARWLFEQLAPENDLQGVEIVRVTVWESEHACASYCSEKPV